MRGAEQLVRDQVRDFVGHGLFQEVLAVLAVQLGIEAQQVLVEMGDPAFWPRRRKLTVGRGKLRWKKCSACR